jgi:cupin 2 domain-containing protein
MKENIFSSIPEDLKDEVFQSIIKNDKLKLERIISYAHKTPEGEWYDQEWDEWVLLIKGAAGLLIEGEDELELQTGDYILLPAHKRHRVTWTAADEETVWLALHFNASVTRRPV